MKGGQSDQEMLDYVRDHDHFVNLSHSRIIGISVKSPTQGPGGTSHDLESNKMNEKVSAG